MPLKDYWNIEDDDYYSTLSSGTTRRLYQTFTATSSYTITSVKLLIYRGSAGTSGNAIVAIKATSAGKPTGADLCSGSVAISALTTSTSGAWVEFTLGAGTALTSGTKYAIVTYNDSTGYHYPRIDTASGYSTGNAGYSTDSGTNWTETTTDILFETYDSVTAYAKKVFGITSTGTTKFLGTTLTSTSKVLGI